MSTLVATPVAAYAYIIGYNMRTVQEPFGYRDVRTTEINTRALDRGPGRDIGSLGKIRGAVD
jgi:hypothetical protein